MSPPTTKKSLSDLVQGILRPSDRDASPRPVEHPEPRKMHVDTPPTNAVSNTTQSAIDHYFEATGGEERDRAFLKLTAVHSPTMDVFLRAMVDEDLDPVMQLAAAIELLKRGHTEIGEILQRYADDESDPAMAADAFIALLSNLPKESALQKVIQTWTDEKRGVDVRCELMETAAALWGAELLALARAQLLHTQPNAIVPDMIEQLILLHAEHDRVAGLAWAKEAQALFHGNRRLIRALEEGMDALID